MVPDILCTTTRRGKCYASVLSETREMWPHRHRRQGHLQGGIETYFASAARRASSPPAMASAASFSWALTNNAGRAHRHGQAPSTGGQEAGATTPDFRFVKQFTTRRPRLETDSTARRGSAHRPAPLTHHQQRFRHSSSARAGRFTVPKKSTPPTTRG